MNVRVRDRYNGKIFMFDDKDTNCIGAERTDRSKDFTTKGYESMKAKAITPILNVSSLEKSFEWFAQLGWKKLWDWGDPPGFGAVGSGECEIFLCQDGQGGRGKGDNTSTFGPGGDETQDKGVWMSIWVENVDQLYAVAIDRGIEVVFPPEDMPWGIREFHVRHPDGHVFRTGQSLEAP